MKSLQYGKWVYQSVYYVAAGLIFAAVFLRTILLYQSTPYLWEVIGVLFYFMVLFFAAIRFFTRKASWTLIYFILQTILVCLLIYGPNYKDYDYFSLLFAILGMQAMQRLVYRNGIVWIGFFLLLISYPFIRFEGLVEGLIRLLFFGSVIIFLSAYSLASKRAQVANSRNLLLMGQLQTANQQLELHTETQKKLGIARERQRLARELHDSVTQTIFSMTLTTQSALILNEREPAKVAGQLNRMNELAKSAMSEMHTLISELRPEQLVQIRFEEAVRQSVQNRHIPEDLSIAIEVDGSLELNPNEERGILRIIQEALNNVIKHAHATNAILHLHLAEPMWIEISDNGQGFDLNKAHGGGRLGLSSMQERANEIGWCFEMHSELDKGTCIRVTKIMPAEERV